METLAERFKRGSSKEHSKQLRLSKAIIGQPIERNEEIPQKIDDAVDSVNNTVGPSMVMKCVIVHNDGNGYGLTVSGDNPVYVQSVKKDGPAVKAGVVQGDRIVKVNGEKVTNMNHLDVVKLIKAGNYVALTLLGTPNAPHAEASASLDSGSVVNTNNFSEYKVTQQPSKLAFFDEKIQTIKQMLEQERVEVERIKEEYTKNPDPKLLKDLLQAQKLKEDLEKQLWKVENTRENNQDNKSTTNTAGITTEVDGWFIKSKPADEVSLMDMEEVDNVADGAEIKNKVSPNNVSMRPLKVNDVLNVNQFENVTESQSTSVMVVDDDKANMDSIKEFQSNNLFTNNSLFPGENGKQLSNQQNDQIMNFEEDDVIVAEFNTDHGPFNDLDTLRRHPAHLAVFFNYVIGSKEPAEFLFTLAVDSYKQLSNTKDMLKALDTIYKTYLSSNASYKIEIEPSIAQYIHSLLGSRNLSEETLRGVFDGATQTADKKIRSQLSIYRMKREQGLGSLFGDEKLQHASFAEQQQSDIRIVDEIIMPTLSEYSQTSAADELDQTRLNILQEALQSFLNQYGTKRAVKSTNRFYSMIRSRQPAPLKTYKVSGSQDSIPDDPNNRKPGGIVKIFNMQKNRKRTESSTMPSPLPHSAELNDSYNNPFNVDVTDDVPSNADNITERNGSRRHRDDENRLSMDSSQSNSDPDKNNANEQTESTFRHHALSTTESTLSLNIEERKLLDGLPNFLDDSEIDIDEAEPHWANIVPKHITKNMDKKEIKRQEIINELIFTEKHHVRDLAILQKLFYERFSSEGLLTYDELHLMFPNLKEILRLHRELKQTLLEVKEKDVHVIKQIGDILLSRFDGEGGDTFKNECATYCGNQSVVLSAIKEKSKSSLNFKQYLEAAQKHPKCRKFHLKDFIPLEFLRLTKYPLLLENIVKNTSKKQEAEMEKVKRAYDRCREILAFVDRTIKEAEDKQKIIEIQKTLDREPVQKLRSPSLVIKEFKDMDLTSRPVIHQGPLTWRLMEKRKAINLHCILFDDVLVLLQKQDDRYVLKCQGSLPDKSEKSSGGTHAPFIKMDSKLIVRNVAIDKRAFFAMPTSDVGPQMYEFVAATPKEMKKWMNLITDTARKRGSSAPFDGRKPGFSASSSTADGSAGKLIGRAEDNSPQEIEVPHDDEDFPVDVSYSNHPNTADILNQINVKHVEIKAAITMKFKLLAEMHGLNEDDLDTIMDISSADSNPDSNTLITHSILCVDKLTGLLNESTTPELSFIKSRNQSQTDALNIHQSQADTLSINHSQVDLQGLNEFHSNLQSMNQFNSESVEEDDSRNSPEKWITQVQSPDATISADQYVGDQSLASVTPSNTGDSDSNEILNDRQDSLDTLIAEDLPFKSDFVEKPSSDSEEQPSNSEHFASDNTLHDSNETVEMSTINGQNLSNNSSKDDLKVESVADVESENAISCSEIVDDAADNIEAPLESTEAEKETDSVDSVPESSRLQPDTLALLDPSDIGAVNSQSIARSDNTSERTKSRPVSGIEICSQTTDVPVSRLMEIVMNLQTQLTQLMQVNEEKDDEMRRLSHENKELKSRLQSRRQSADGRLKLPSYDEAISQGNPPADRTTSSVCSAVTVAQDSATVRSSMLQHSSGSPEVLPETDSRTHAPSSPTLPGSSRVTRRSTGF